MALRRIDVGDGSFHPAYVVWELTLRCDQRCTHCGSRADVERPDELTTQEALAVVEQLRAMGAREVVLIGGEAYLHPGFLEIVGALRAAQIRPSMTTGGRGITRELAWKMGAAGLHTVSVSIDGLEATHDLMRASPGSFRSATEALGHLRAAGIRTASNINLNRLNRDDLEPLYLHLKDLAVRAWQIQITAPLGRAADRPAMLLQPYDLVTLVPRVAELKRRAFDEARMVVMPGNNLGYFGPEEAALRSLPDSPGDHWRGCQAGRFVMGIESDGAVKGCPSLQTSHYVGGNVRKSPLAQIWAQSPEVGFTRNRGVEALWGFCRECPFAATCLGGCTFTAHAVLGRPGNNPYCHFRAKTLAARGVRERLVAIAPAPGKPFDSGLFEIREEAIDAPDPLPPLPRQLVRRTNVPSRS